MELLASFETAFAKLREELGFKATLDKLDEIFFIRDAIQRERFVSTSLSRQVCHRIADLFNSWSGYLHNLIVPPPGNMILAAESGLFSEDEKAYFIQTMNKFMAHTSKNGLVGLTKDKTAEAAYIDESISLWNETKPLLVSVLTTTNAYWTKQGTKLPRKQKQETYFN